MGGRRFRGRRAGDLSSRALRWVSSREAGVIAHSCPNAVPSRSLLARDALGAAVGGYRTARGRDDHQRGPSRGGAKAEDTRPHQRQCRPIVRLRPAPVPTPRAVITFTVTPRTSSSLAAVHRRPCPSSALCVGTSIAGFLLRRGNGRRSRALQVVGETRRRRDADGPRPHSAPTRTLPPLTGHVVTCHYECWEHECNAVHEAQLQRQLGGSSVGKRRNFSAFVATVCRQASRDRASGKDHVAITPSDWGQDKGGFFRARAHRDCLVNRHCGAPVDCNCAVIEAST